MKMQKVLTCKRLVHLTGNHLQKSEMTTGAGNRWRSLAFFVVTFMTFVVRNLPRNVKGSSCHLNQKCE